MTVAEYIEQNIDRTVYFDEPGTGFRGIDLPYRYTSPCIKGEGKFYFCFYWDTYFTDLALLATGRAQIAKENIRNMLWLIKRQGYMPNHTGIANRSQPPYLCRMVKDYFAHPSRPEPVEGDFFRACAEGLLTEYNWWMSARLNGSGLNRYGVHETWEEMVTFAEWKRVAEISLSEGKSIEEKRRIGAHFLANAESGLDFNPAFQHRCLDFVPPDLNGLLYEYELFFAEHSEALGWDYGIDWSTRAERRVALINQYLWNEERGLFMDFDSANHRHSPVATLTGMQLMAHGIPTEEQAARMVSNLPRFEREYGVAFTEEHEGCRNYQWAFPNAWPPLTYMVFIGLDRYGYTEEARRIAGKYVDTTDRLFTRTGQIWEKIDTLTGEVAGGEYDAAPMIGWTAGVYLAFQDYLSA